jgi:predicted transcriptional regulator
MNNRSRTDIIAQILEAAANGGGGTTKTDIMYKASLNSEQLKNYLNALLESELIAYDAKNSKYKTTEKGFSFLRAYAQMDDLMHKKSMR